MCLQVKRESSKPQNRVFKKTKESYCEVTEIARSVKNI